MLAPGSCRVGGRVLANARCKTFTRHRKLMVSKQLLNPKHIYVGEKLSEVNLSKS